MPNICSNCKATLDSDASFCSNCKAPVNQAIICSSCNTTNNLGAKFCKSCSNDLQTSFQSKNYDSYQSNYQRFPTAYPVTPAFLDDYDERTQISHQNRNDSKRKLFIVSSILGGLLIISIVSGLIYINQLKWEIYNLNSQMEGKDKDSMNLQKQVEEKDVKINDSQQMVEQKDEELKKQNTDLSKWKSEAVKVKGKLTAVSTCIDGIRRLQVANSTNSGSLFLDGLEQTKSNCEKADKIVEEFRKLPD
jgi:hypothetical protein